MENKQLTKIPDITSWGKILSNPRKVALLRELSKGNIPKSKAADMLNVRLSTVAYYVKELTDIGVVDEYHMLKDGVHLVRMLRLTCPGILVEFSHVEASQGGWKDVI